jgi:integrase
MTEKNPTTHTLIDRQLNVYLRERSAIWQCAYQVDGKWQRTSTGQKELALAKKAAHEILIKANIRKQMNVAPITRYFKDIAKLAIERMDTELAAGQGKVIYVDYKIAINKYLIPSLGKYHVDNIDHKALAKLDEDRIKAMGKTPTRSTLVTHNAALNRVFDEAIIRGFMVESNRPKLQAKGQKSQRRPEFNLNEITALKGNFDAWIDNGRADSQALRALLRDYVNVLLDTGARPGDELLNLNWTNIELNMYPVITPTDQMDEEGERIDIVNANRTVIFSIESGKTGKRKAIGRLPSVKALNNIAQRNHGKTLKEMLDKGSQEPIFRYREYLNEAAMAVGKSAKLIAPTSFSKLFDSYLEDHNLLIDPITAQRRVLYSLRHTYATLALTHDKVAIHTLAKQMGTSVVMIEKHYSHLDAVKAVHQLRGEESRQLMANTEVDQRYEFKGTKKRRK